MATTQAPMSSDERRGQCRDQNYFLCVLSACLRPLCIGVNSHHWETFLWQVCSSCGYKSTVRPTKFCLTPGGYSLRSCDITYVLKCLAYTPPMHKPAIFKTAHVAFPSHKISTVHDAPYEFISCRHIFLIASGGNTWRFCKTVVSGTVECSSRETQSISVAMER
jgi:hypothetical protein